MTSRGVKTDHHIGHPFLWQLPAERPLQGQHPNTKRRHGRGPLLLVDRGDEAAQGVQTEENSKSRSAQRRHHLDRRQNISQAVEDKAEEGQGTQKG